MVCWVCFLLIYDIYIMFDSTYLHIDRWQIIENLSDDF